MTTTDILNKIKSEKIRKIFDEYKIKHVYLFGSYARGEQKKDSDIDIIYENKKGSKFTLFDLLNMQSKLEKVLDKKVDIVERKAINKHYKKYIENDKILVF